MNIKSTYMYINVYLLFLLLSELHFIIKIERIHFAESSAYKFSINIIITLKYYFQNNKTSMCL